MSWMGPRRALLVLAIISITMGWIYQDVKLFEFAPGDAIPGSFGIAIGIVLILTVLMYSALTTCAGR